MPLADCSGAPAFKGSLNYPIHVGDPGRTCRLEARNSRFPLYFSDLLGYLDFALFEVDAFPSKAERLAQTQAAFQAEKP